MRRKIGGIQRVLGSATSRLVIELSSSEAEATPVLQVQQQPQEDIPIHWHDYLETMRTNHPERLAERFHQPDFNNVQYDDEAVSLLETQSLPYKNTNPGLYYSLVLLTRIGHRRRVTDLIGGIPYPPGKHRQVLAQHTFVFSTAGVNTTTTAQRNYATHPIRLPLDDCESCRAILPCASCRKNLAKCDGLFQTWSMENVKWSSEPLQDYALTGTVDLRTNIPLAYFSWHDFGLWKNVVLEQQQPLPPQKKIAAAFISNCGFKKRIQMVHDLMERLPRVDAFGRCFAHKVAPGQDVKLKSLDQYKFSLAFENSETKDYVTEKLFGAWVSGSVPVYLGAPNVKFFAPDTTPYPYESNALIRTGDFQDDANVLAQVLDTLDRHPALYSDLLAWKTNGFSDDFKALVDLTAVHSTCRACIYLADERRHRLGPSAYDLDVVHVVNNNREGSTFLFVRERGSYSFFQINRPSRFVLVVEQVLARIPQANVNLWKDNEDKRPLRNIKRVYAIYTVGTKRPVLSDEDLAVLPDNAELEVIFV